VSCLQIYICTDRSQCIELRFLSDFGRFLAEKTTLSSCSPRHAYLPSPICTIPFMPWRVPINIEKEGCFCEDLCKREPRKQAQFCFQFLLPIAWKGKNLTKRTCTCVRRCMAKFSCFPSFEKLGMLSLILKGSNDSHQTVGRQNKAQGHRKGLASDELLQIQCQVSPFQHFPSTRFLARNQCSDVSFQTLSKCSLCSHTLDHTVLIKLFL